MSKEKPTEECGDEYALHYWADLIGALTMTTILVFSHLRWDFVYQRPQHLLSRLARHYRIVVMEEPVFREGTAFLKSYSPAANVTVLQPHTPVPARGFDDSQMPVLKSLLAGIVGTLDDTIAWFYTPMALPLLPAIRPGLVVYDCMDDLTHGSAVPAQMREREQALLDVADVVFTGGPSACAAKRAQHANVHCIPSSVDLPHFSQSLDRGLAHQSQLGLRSPRMGYFGVIDERFDMGLLKEIADARPQWDVVIVGPMLNIAPSALPSNPNIHYMGKANYYELPRYLAAWNVCLMPFALKPCTSLLSPVKVLEYMAAKLPIVSTAINDVVTQYGRIISIARSAQEFIDACDAALAMPPERRARMASQMGAVVRSTSWEATVKTVCALLQGGAHLHYQPIAAHADRTHGARMQADRGAS